MNKSCTNENDCTHNLNRNKRESKKWSAILKESEFSQKVTKIDGTSARVDDARTNNNASEVPFSPRPARQSSTQKHRRNQRSTECKDTTEAYKGKAEFRRTTL